MIAVTGPAPRYKEDCGLQSLTFRIRCTVCFTMRIVQRIPTLLIIVYVCIGSGYTQTNNCGLQKFRCRNGDCIASDLLCDGKTDCRDLSDETEAECKRPEILCPNYAFRCNYGGCIDRDLVCNGVPNCADNSDETQPQCLNTTNGQTERPGRRCRENEFKCDNGQCISSTAVCDGTRNCADGSDETSKLCQSLPCHPTAFRCAYGACIDGDLRCNRVDDCADGSDEDQGLCRTGWPSVLPSVRPTTGTTRSPPTPAPTRPSGTPSGTNTCKAPPQPENGSWKLHRSQCSNGQDCNVPEGTELGLGSYLVYSCDSGYKIRGSRDVSCSIGGKWLNIPVCTAILCKALAAPSIRSECQYDDAWISCKSPVPPRTRATLSCANSYRSETNQHLLSGQGTQVRCKANGEWEPEPMRCVPVCGTLPLGYQPTVVGGFRPNITEFPWHASMYRDEPGEPKKYFCGASIIQENLLITAAHCVYDETNRQPINANKIYILAGNLFRDYNNPFHDPNLIKRNQVKRIYIARDYLGFIGNYLWDIAVLELVTPFVLSSYLVPACIDTLSYGSVLEPGTLGKVAGFGRTATGESSAVLQALTVPVISVSQCRSASQSVNTEQFITNDKFCAGYTNGSSVCDGDSGGGLVFKTNDLWYLRGIVSVSLGTIKEGGSFHCNHNLYSLYTEISRHISWVQDVIIKIEQNQTHTLCSEQSPIRCS
ncbi:modular serine protease [Temnothorax nylanderi]|uniref:modular serine protease n=1 Tax=Temnothorax nylanderi TaxID=102681 RepID=UPI003A8910E5